MKFPNEDVLDATRREADFLINIVGSRLDEAVDEVARTIVIDMRAILYPEDYPGYDPSHPHWDGLEPLSDQEQGQLVRLEEELAVRGPDDESNERYEVEALAFQLRSRSDEVEEAESYEWDSDTMRRVNDWVEDLDYRLRMSGRFS